MDIQLSGQSDLATIEILEAGPAVVVRVIGEIDRSNANTLKAALQRTVSGDNPAPVVVDLAGVSFLDASGLAALIYGGRLAGRLGMTMLLARPSRAVRRVLKLTGLESALTIQGED